MDKYTEDYIIAIERIMKQEDYREQLETIINKIYEDGFSDCGNNSTLIIPEKYC